MRQYVQGIVIGLAHGILIGMWLSQRLRNRRETE